MKKNERCKNCIYFESDHKGKFDTENPVFSICTSPTFHNETGDANGIMLVSKHAAIMQVSSEFGCVHFEKR